MNMIVRGWRNFLVWMTPVENMDESVYKEAIGTLTHLHLNYTDEQVTDIINQTNELVRDEKISTIEILTNELNRKKDDLEQFNNLIPETLDET